MSCVWVQLYYKGMDVPSGRISGIRPVPEDIDELIDQVKAKLKPKINNVPADEISVYPPIAASDRKKPYSSGKKLSELIDELKTTTPPISDDHPLIVVAPDPKQANEQKIIKTSILGDGLLEKLRLAVIYFVDSNKKPIGTGFFVGPRVAISAAHTFTESVTVATKRTGYFGKPHVGRTCQLVVDLIDRENDFIVFVLKEGVEDAPEYLEPAPVGLVPGDECILVAYQIGIHHELKELGKEPSVGVFPGAIMKAHERHFVYSASSFAGDSGGAIILQGGQASGMHIMTVNQALELQRLKSLDEDEATTGDIVQHVNSVEKSVASLIESLSSGALGLSISSVMAAYQSNPESKRRAS